MSLSTVVILIFYTCSQSRVDAAEEGEIFGPALIALPHYDFALKGRYDKFSYTF